MNKNIENQQKQLIFAHHNKYLISIDFDMYFMYNLLANTIYKISSLKYKENRIGGNFI